jgi:hypothetical protein
VARLARVSTATVSRAINATGAVSDPTRQRVLRAVQKLHYYPNAHARSLALGRSDQIGLLVSDIANPFFPELVKAIERDAYQRGFEVILAETDYDHERLAKSVRRFLERDVAGVIIMASEVDMPLVAGLARRRVPLVFLDLEVTGQGTSTVSVDYGRGIDEAVHHLAELGHRELAYVSGPPTLSSAVKRLQAFRAAVARYIGPRAHPRVYGGDFRLESGLRAGSRDPGRAGPAHRDHGRQRPHGARRHEGVPGAGPVDPARPFRRGFRRHRLREPRRSSALHGLPASRRPGPGRDRGPAQQPRGRLPRRDAGDGPHLFRGARVHRARAKVSVLP